MGFISREIQLGLKFRHCVDLKVVRLIMMPPNSAAHHVPRYVVRFSQCHLNLNDTKSTSFFTQQNRQCHFRFSSP
jgi:hypothetical protein